MAIEIQELHIRINVDEGGREQRGNSDTHEERERIIAAAVERVMEILARKEER